MRLFDTITEIWRFKHNGVTTLTFWGYVTSSVTWPFDSRGSTSYRWFIVTMRLSNTVMEIWPFEVLPGRFFQEQRSVLNITLISSLRSERSARGVKNTNNVCKRWIKSINLVLVNMLMNSIALGYSFFTVFIQFCYPAFERKELIFYQ